MIAVKEFIQEMEELMASHCEAYEVIFQRLQQMRTERNCKNLIRQLALMRVEVRNLPDTTVAIFQKLHGHPVKREPMPIVHQLECAMREVEYMLVTKQMVNETLQVLEQIQECVRLQAKQGLCVVRDLTVVRFNFERGEFDYRDLMI